MCYFQVTCRHEGGELDGDNSLICPVLTCFGDRPIPYLYSSINETPCPLQASKASPPNIDSSDICNATIGELCLAEEECDGIWDLKLALKYAQVEKLKCMHCNKLLNINFFSMRLLQATFAISSNSIWEVYANVKKRRENIAANQDLV